MDAALGPPDEMRAHEGELTPMIAQYVELCDRYDDSLVLFHVGDFYKTFCEAAETVARLCELTLTTREDSTGEYPMAGIPVDNAESYVETLLNAGYRVAIAEQVEDPDTVTGVAERAVTRVVTPGTLTEHELLAGDDNNFVACLTRDDTYGLAVLDVSTGDFYATSTSEQAIEDEVGRFSPAEAVVGPEVDVDPFEPGCVVTRYDERAFDLDAARERVAAYFGSDGPLAGRAEIRACGALLAYAEYARGAGEELAYLNRLTRYDPREYVRLDAAARESLELFDRRDVRSEGDALIDVLEETACALGSRQLADWLRRPSLDRDEISARLDAVEELAGMVRERERVQDLLRDVYDLERLISRVSRGRADARDLRALRATLKVVPEIRGALDDAGAERLASLRDGLDELRDARELIDRAIREDPPTEITEGDVIKRGYSDELDELRDTERAGKEWIDSLEARERERTGIDSLKVGYNHVHGYYIEVTDPNVDRVPDDYTRRQTLKNAERFYTPELKRREDEIVRAESAADDLEYSLFRDVRDRVAEDTERVQRLASALGELDALASLAEVAVTYDYCRPDLAERGEGIEIRRGRHPVVERNEDSFVPNDAHLDDSGFFAVITGPNMSGKSTYMRQVALIVIMAQIGSFVPAAAARVGLTDRVFTRVGASDDIAGGRSTFMIEMTELARILRDATDESLILLDEVGRGTSTADGFAIARAITEFIHDEVRAKTLFATHHHDLTAVADDLDGAVNLHFDADRSNPEIAFDHEIAPGPATASYGVDVARMAGVPDPVVRRSRELVDDDRGTEARADDESEPARTGHAPSDESTISARSADLPATLRSMDLAEMTPLEALNELARLKERVEED